MSKTIKIIDLLNMISRGEEMPEKIIYGNEILKYNKDSQDYMGLSRTGSGSLFNYLFVNKCTNSFINETIKILEEQEEIDIQSIEEIHRLFIESSTSDDDVKFLARKYNEMLQAVKQIDNKLKEK